MGNYHSVRARLRRLVADLRGRRSFRRRVHGRHRPGINPPPEQAVTVVRLLGDQGLR